MNLRKKSTVTGLVFQEEELLTRLYLEQELSSRCSVKGEEDEEASVGRAGLRKEHQGGEPGRGRSRATPPL